MYPYTSHLLELESRRPRDGSERVRGEWSGVHTPLRSAEWEAQLREHPDRPFVQYLLRGMREGFRVGFRYDQSECGHTGDNMQSARDNPEVIDEYLEKEVRLGRVAGPFEPEACHQVHMSRFGVIPKNHQPGKWRLIVDLSHPQGGSVNDGIEPELCSLRYTSVEEAARRVRALGPGTLLAKIDVESAYRTVPVHPADRWLLGMRWKGKVYVDTALPFGLRSAPKIFNAIADALQWILAREGCEVIHYLDDFLLFGRAGSGQCRRVLERALELCEKLGVPIAVHKTEGPAPVLTFLGIELDTVAMTLRLPEEKLRRLQREIGRWTERRGCTKRELLSLIGQLQHACCVVRPGRSFLRRMIELSKIAKEPHHRLRLNKGFKSDLRWWACFLSEWNGVNMMTGVIRSECQATVTSDASGSWGCGAFTSSGEWFQLELLESWNGVHITVKELLPIVLGAAIWGREWAGKTVRCRCDNAAAVAIINSGKSKVERAMHLMRSLFFFLASFGVVLVAEHLPGRENGAADALSRDNIAAFHSQVPCARQHPTPIPPMVVQALVTQQPDWTAVSWTNLLTTTL